MSMKKDIRRLVWVSNLGMNFEMKKHATWNNPQKYCGKPSHHFYFFNYSIEIELIHLNSQPQGAGRVFDPPKKFTIDETPIFWSGMTWGTMFTKVISPGQVEAQ